MDTNLRAHSDFEGLSDNHHDGTGIVIALSLDAHAALEIAVGQQRPIKFRYLLMSCNVSINFNDESC